MSKAVMTIHGFLTDISDFGRLYDYLDFYDEVHKCKIPGHNDNVDFQKFNVEDTLSAVLGDYDGLKKRHDSVDVVGFSMGGALTSFLCAERDVNRAVMVAPSNKYLNFTSIFALMRFYFDNFRESYAESPGAVSNRLRMAGQWLKPYTENSITSLKIGLNRILPHIGPHTYGVFKELMQKCNAALEKRGKTDVPSMLLWGELDELVPRASSEHIEKYFTDLDKRIYKDVGHAMLLTNRDTYLIRDIVKFLSEGEIDREIPPRPAEKKPAKKKTDE